MCKPAGRSRIIRKRYGVNDFAEWLANDSGKTQNEQKTIIERIVDFINAVIDKISAVFGELYDTNGSPVLAVLALLPNDKNGNFLNIIKIASAYGKNTNPQSLINTSDILYINPNKKSVRTWLSVNRLQLPLPSSKYGLIKKLDLTSINSISKSNKNVKNSLDVDEFDEKEYNYPQLNQAEYKRLYSEILRWHANHTNQIIEHRLDNGYKYICRLDEDYKLTVFGKYKSINIHERYKNDDGTRNSITQHSQISGSNRGHSGNSIFSIKNTKTAGSNVGFFGTDLQQERQSDQRGNAEVGNNDNLREKNSLDVTLGNE